MLQCAGFFTCDVGYRCAADHGGCYWHAASVTCTGDGVFEEAECEAAPCPHFSQRKLQRSQSVGRWVGGWVGRSVGSFALSFARKLPFDGAFPIALLAVLSDGAFSSEGRTDTGVSEDPTEGCECIENYEGTLRWERVSAAWEGLCEGEWELAERRRAALFGTIGALAMLAAVVSFAVARRWTNLEQEACRAPTSDILVSD
eukprot:SAG11_NODE_2193_length_3702_cov_6.080242_6_plen_201_part_00